ncbi:hypothetical protein H2199_002244 [Coniosporium tulheliwenetii]|uniref:Uncharacterized protein n=1 Tax=Coniosporium tulheliwenetii TaxID=3383036 RepID=A0ACC2ZIA1_9PEZI|nr:hypothetical protein H2199_002244 [Cladosporium sp. JES 115]
MSGVSAAPSLLPVPHGIYKFYGNLPSGWRHCGNASDGVANLIAILKELAFGWRQGRTQPTAYRLDKAVMLFTGYEATTELSEASAKCVKGICFYFDILRELSYDTESLGHIRVVPGRIEHNGRSSRLVQDMYDMRDPSAELSERFNDTLEGAYTFDSPDSVSMLVKHTLTCLEICCKLTDGFNKPVYVLPSYFEDSVSQSRAPVRCEGTNCSTVVEGFVEPKHNEWITVQGRQLMFVQGHEITCAAFLAEFVPRATSKLIFRRAECIQCCLRTSFQFSPEVRMLIICS